MINPKIEGESIDWKNLSQLEVEEKLNELDFIGKSCLTLALNKLEFTNVNKNKSVIEDFGGQLELGSKTNIPHYQLALKTDTICSRPQVLKALEESINGHISVNIQFNLESMKDYCTKETEFILPEYSGKIYKHEWDMNFLDRKPRLKKVLQIIDLNSSHSQIAVFENIKVKFL